MPIIIAGVPGQDDEAVAPREQPPGVEDRGGGDVRRVGAAASNKGQCAYGRANKYLTNSVRVPMKHDSPHWTLRRVQYAHGREKTFHDDPHCTLYTDSNETPHVAEYA